MEQEINNAIDTLNKNRKIRLFLLVLFIVLASVFGAGGFGLGIFVTIAQDNINTATKIVLIVFAPLSFFCLLPTFIFLSIRQVIKYRECFFQTLSPILKGDYYEEFNYRFKVDLSKMRADLSKCAKKIPDPISASYYEGKIDGFNFRSFGFERNISLIQAYKKQEKKNYHPKGRYIEFDLNKTNEHELLIERKNKFSLFNKVNLPNEAISESIKFNELYKVTSDAEPYVALQILSTPLISGIIELHEMYKGYVSAYFKKDKACFYFDYYVTDFYYSLAKKVDYNYVMQFKQEVLLPYNLFKLLYIEYYSHTL